MVSQSVASGVTWLRLAGPGWRRRCGRSGRAGCCRGRRTWTRRCSSGSSGTSSAAAGCAWRAAISCRSPATSGPRRPGPASVLLVRGEDGALRAFANTCRHRGHELLPCGEGAQHKMIICPYHAWTYSLDGDLRAAATLQEGAAASTSASGGCARLPVTEWHGLVFVDTSGGAAGSLDADAGQARRDRRAVRAGAAGDRRAAQLRRRGELEDPHRELPRVLPLPVHPPRAVPGQPAARAARTTPRTAPGSAAGWTCGTAWTPCRWTARATGSRCAAWTSRGCAPSSTSTSCRTSCSACIRTT